MGQKETKFYNRVAGGAKSGNINRISYYPERSIMEVQFKNSQVYQYIGVSSKIWEQAVDAPSIGKFMSTSIKGVYKYKLI